MARWEPNAVGRLQEAAMELFLDPGYEKVAVAELAARAGLSRRTFFRHFADKREVLFFGTEKIATSVTAAIAAAPDGTSALEAVALALLPIAKLSDDDATWAGHVRQRNTVIQANAELRERELTKHAALAVAITSALRSRGVTELASRLAAEAGLAAFKVGFEQWIEDPQGRPMARHIRDALRGLGPVVAGAVVLAPAAASRGATTRKRQRP